MSINTERGRFSRAAVHRDIQWEQTACLLCGGSNWSEVLRAPDAEALDSGLEFTVVCCQDCGLWFTNPRPAPASMGRFYPHEYAPHRRPPSAPRRPKRRGLLRRWLGDPRDEMRLPELQGQLRLLDFGCGAGEFLQQAQTAGWQVTGIDVSPRVVDFLRRELGIRALVGTLPQPELTPESFDVVTLWHSLEHAHQPREVLRSVYELLVPGGRIMLSVPNAASGPRRWFGPAWYGLDVPRHLTHFAPDTLRAMVQRVGFEVEQLRLVQHPSWLEGSIQRARQQAIAVGWRRWLVRRPLRRLTPWCCVFGGQADCMVLRARRP